MVLQDMRGMYSFSVKLAPSHYLTLSVLGLREENVLSEDSSEKSSKIQYGAGQPKPASRPT